MESESLPDEQLWHSIHTVGYGDLPRLKPTEFLQKHRLSGKLEPACRKRAQQEVHEKLHPNVPLDEVVSKVKVRFVREARQYLAHLCAAVQDHVSGTSDIVKGLASFDPHVLFVLPLSQASTSFGYLYRSFSHRGWVATSEEELCHDEYLTFIDHLRTSYPDQRLAPDVIPDIVQFLVSEPGLQSRPLLYRLFKLSCLCLTSTSPSLPAVKFGPDLAGSLSSRMVDLVQPVQSYIANVPDVDKLLTSPDSLERFSKFAASVGEDLLSSEYDPWTSVDSFGCSEIAKKLHDSKVANLRAPESSSDSNSNSPRKIRVGARATKRSYEPKVGSISFTKALSDLREQSGSGSK